MNVVQTHGLERGEERHAKGDANARGSTQEGGSWERKWLSLPPLLILVAGVFETRTTKRRRFNKDTAERRGADFYIPCTLL
jgi:hypothetical protein